MNLDGVLYIFGSIPMLIVSLISILINFVIYLGNGMPGIGLVINMLMFIFPALILPITTAMIAMKLDKKPIKPMVKGLLCYPLFMGSWLLINVKCLFKRQLTWEKIEHVRDIKISDVSNYNISR